VKELVENAIDAGAMRIEVDLLEGGLESIRVRDDGEGIVPDELALAVAAHATSKVATAEDLDGIATMGFRGEALASIGSVSRLELLSRRHDAEAGARLVVDNGDVSGVEPAASPPGTTMTVGRLFARVPARRKFLKTPRAESGRVRRVLRDLAAAHPSVGFTFSTEGIVRLELPTGQAPRDRLVALLGRELGDSLIDIDVERDSVSMWGVVGPPDTARPASTHQIICLNGRPIVDRAIRQALREAFRGLIEPSRHPIAALFIGVDPTRVDVNVHPAKTEVRLRDERLIFVVVRDAVRRALEGRDLIPDLPLPLPERRPEARALFGAGNVMTAADGPSATQVPAAQASRFASDPIDGIKPAARFMQLHDMWLVVEDEQGIVIVDQHALHERVMFEQLLERIGQGDLPAQHLMVPVAVEVGGDATTALASIVGLTKRLGFDLTPLGPSTIAVHAAPVLLVERRVDLARFVEDLLDRAGALHEADDETALRDVLDMMACKAAIKAGDRLTERELQDLLQQREAIERSSNCPHGRPTSMRLTLDDLEQRFGRR
jgi:DNA mismatch repair protein MutL